MLHGCERHVNVFEEGLGGDALDASGGLDEVVAGAAGLFAAESVGKDHWFGELTGAHQKTGAVDGPLTFQIHKYFFHPSAGAVFVDFRFQIFTEHDHRSAKFLIQVERLYAQKEDGSIP